MDSNYFVNSFEIMSQQLEYLEEHKNHILRRFLVMLGIGNDVVERFIKGKYNCLFYIPAHLVDHLPENLDLYLPNGCRIYPSNPFGEEQLNVELRKIENTDSLYKRYAISLHEMKVSKYMVDWLKRDSLLDVEVEPDFSDKSLAMAMALQAQVLQQKTQHYNQNE